MTTTPTFSGRRFSSSMLLGCATAVALTAAGSAFAGAPTTYQPGQIVGTIDTTSIDEASGLVAGHGTPGTLWTHNDSGDSARVFALDTQGRLLATCSLTGKTAVDFEDIARGPGPMTGVTYLYVGDLGNNALQRPLFPVYRFPEPVVNLEWAGEPHGLTVSTTVHTFRLQYPESAIVEGVSPNAETMFVDPANGDLYVATKTAGSTSVYVALASQLVNNTTITMSLVTTITLTNTQLITGGDIAPDGSAIILRGLNFAKLWERGSGQTIAQALAGTPIAVPVANEGQGEAICFADDGLGYYTLSEGTSQPLYFYAPGEATPTCTADFNDTNGVTVQDIFDFLTAWLAGSNSADFNDTNGVTVQDIFDFLTAWLAGC